MLGLFQKHMAPIAFHSEAIQSHQIREYTDASDLSGSVTTYILPSNKLDLARSTWQYLEEAVGNVGVTSTWDWIDTWLNHYGDVIEYWFVVGVKNSMPCGIVLVTKEIHRLLPLPVHSYHIGTNGEPYRDIVRMIHNGMLVKEEAKTAFLTVFLKTIMTQFPWEEIVFDDYEATDADIVAQVLRKQNINVHMHRNACRFFDLDRVRKNNTTVLNELSHDTRYSIKRSLKVFQNDLEIEWAEDAHNAIDIFDELAVLFQSTWRKCGKRGIFSSDRYVNFHHAIIPKLLKHKSLILFRVKSKQYGTLGCLYLIVDRGVAYGYQLGLNDFAETDFVTINKKRLKIGFIVHTLCMQECLKRKIKAYNFSIGDYLYKKELTNGVSEVVTVSMRRGIKPLMRDSLISLYLKMEEGKKTPMMLRFIKKIL